MSLKPVPSSSAIAGQSGPSPAELEAIAGCEAVDLLLPDMNGLLRGKRASSHWRARELLARFGAIPSDERMCVDGNIYTAGGVTSGIDMGLKVVAALCGVDVAKLIQLKI